MARISNEELERLKRDVSLERLVTAKGVALEKRGDGLHGLCPFHEDKTPSLVVTPKKNLFRCFGCGAAGSTIDWVMKAEGVTFRHAAELLREGVDLAGPVGPRVATIPKLQCPLDAEATDAVLLDQVVDYYQRTLKAAPEALAYLELRGLKQPQLIDAFRLGFANRTLGLRIPDGNRDAGAKLRGRLQKLGVVRESGHEHLNGSLVVPLCDEGGAVVGMYGRKVTPNLRPGTALHLYLPGPHRTAFNSAALAGQRAAIICEAVLDALSFWAAGFRNVTAAYGVEGFTELHLEALKRHGVRDVLIAFDRDDAGDAGAEALAKKLLPEGFQCWRVLFPRGLDANAYALKVQPASKSLGVALRQAAWMGKGSAPGAPDLAATAESSARPTAASPLAAQAAPPAARATAPAVPVAVEGKKSAASVVPAKSGEISTAAVSSASAAAAAPPAAAEPPLLPVVPKAPEVAAEVTEEEVVLHFGPRRYRVRGLSKALSAEALKVNVLVSQGDVFHVDTLDMYSARQRAAFLRAAADELRLADDVVKRDMGALLLKLEALQEEQLKEKLQPKKLAPSLTDEETAEAMDFLSAPNLLTRLVDDFERCGVVGEETNKLLGYLAAVSRKLDEPLAVLVQSSSAAGKSALMEACLAFVPDEDKVKYSAVTGQSLFYMGDADLKHKVLAVVEEEGASRAAYALKLLQSEGELTIASTGKDPTTGKLVTHEYRVEGPTQLFLTTTASELDEELLNRCLVLSVDEERAQTRAIHEKQREKQTLSGLLARRERDAVLRLHQNAQRLLRPLLVANPFAPRLTFLDDRTRARRDFPKYLTLIRTLALLHQHQRPVRTVQHLGQTVEYVEATLDDIAVANRLAAAVLGRSLDDLPPQTRRLLEALDGWVKAGCQLQSVQRPEFRFTRRQVREALGWGDTQLKVHLGRLLDAEYLALHRLPKGGLGYELLYAGQGVDGQRFLVGLVDVEALRHEYDAGRSGLEEARAAPGRPAVGGRSAPGRGVLLENSPSEERRNGAAGGENALPGGSTKKSSYPNSAAQAV